MRDIDLSLELTDHEPASVSDPEPPPPIAGELVTSEDEERSRENAQSLEALYRALIEREKRLVAMLAEQEKRLREQAERDKRLESLLAPTEEQQQARYARLNEFLRQLMERTEQSAAIVVKRAETAADEQRDQVRRETASWRRTATRRLTVLMLVIAILLTLQAAGVGYILWRSFAAPVAPQVIQEPAKTLPPPVPAPLKKKPVPLSRN